MNKRMLSKILNIIGIMLMIAVIVVVIPLTIPKLFGYRIYGVLTESMTPAYSVGSVIYIRECGAQEITDGDVITFRLGNGTAQVVTHRVVDILEEEKAFITKGDANNTPDPEPIRYERLVGKVVFSIPKMGRLSDSLQTTTGKAVVFIIFALAFLFWIVADMIDPKEKKAQGPAATGKAGAPNWIMIGGVLLILASGICMGVVLVQYNRGEKEYRSLQEQVFGGKQVQTGDDTAEDVSGTTEMGRTREQEQAIMDAVAALQNENKETIGWIEFDYLNISYPIMQAEDNDKYLKVTFSGERNSAGSIFLEAANHKDFEDYHTIIYGHNMRNGSMFGKLKQYKTKDFYEENRYFTIYTSEERYRYEIFSYYDISEYGDVYTIGFGPDETYKEFLDNMKKRSYYETGVEVNETDKVITLSTCSTKGKRFVVHAKRISNNG